ncbi:MAG: hypothetical protein ACLFN8_04175 [Candidatus Woesearchaeota archaeon]
MKPDVFLNAEDELKLFLVKANILPIAEVSLDMFSSAEKYTHNMVLLNQEGFERVVFQKLPSYSFMNSFCEYLTSTKVPYLGPTSIKSSFVDNNKVFQFVNFKFRISNNFKYLDLLSGNLSTFDYLKLWGWPDFEADAYLKAKNKLSFSDLQFKFFEAKEKEVLPEWCAYLMYVPATFDLVEEDVKLNTIAHCNNIKRFVRRNDSDLASRVEDYFLSKSYPFKKESDGSYFVDSKWISLYNSEYFAKVFN